MRHKSLPPAIFLMGPTASGKTALAVQLAQAVGCEIISVDSALVFRGMDIGTAKPGLDERAGIAHHLIDILDPSEVFSTGEFKARAEELMLDITRRGNIPLLTGGTMLYFNALVKGLADLPSANEQIRQQIEQEAAKKGWPFLHQRLIRIDAESAARIHPNDPQRIQRALEVYELSGRPISVLQAEAKEKCVPFDIIKFVIAPEHRSQLHIKIASRFEQMLAAGLIDEVKQLYVRGDLSESMPSIRAVGYRQIWRYLNAEYGYDTMVDKAIIATRQLAKRQYTWLRREQDAYWYNTGQADLLSAALLNIKQHKVQLGAIY